MNFLNSYISLPIFLLTFCSTALHCFDGNWVPFDKLEFQHLFGKVNLTQVPSYDFTALNTVDRNSSNLLSFSFHGQVHQFEIIPVKEALFDHAFYYYNRHHLPPEKEWHRIASCLYTGKDVTSEHNRIALAGCGKRKRGIASFEDGTYLLIQPVPPNARTKMQNVTSKWNADDTLHVLHKRSTDYDRTKATCMHDFTELKFKDEPASDEKHHETAAALKGPLTVELALFVDAKIYKQFRNIYGNDMANTELLNFVLATINNINALFQHPSLHPSIYFKIKKFHVFKNTPPELADTVHGNGEATLLLNAFCQYQNSINPASDTDPRHWDHALLFSGYDLYSGSVKAVAGFAPVGGMCSPLKSCTINEGADFGCSFVIAHEIGHNLGMIHDGDNECNANCCLMSPFVGEGKTSWSKCSVNELHRFLKKLRHVINSTTATTNDGQNIIFLKLNFSSKDTVKNCLLDNDITPEVLSINKKPYAGQMYNVDQQCKKAHGNGWIHQLQPKQSLSDICRMIWCSAGEGIIRNTHPALEGTYCGPKKWCFHGKCQSWLGSDHPPYPVNGQWSMWRTNVEDECTECVIGDQVRLRLAQRLCNRPQPNNGGRNCPGAEYRAVICTETVKCSGLKVNEFATKKCSEWKANFPTILSGVGLQHNEQSCKIWCHVQSSDYAHSVGNFPDGTPCTNGGHCVRGKCMHFLCKDKATLVEDESSCPEKDIIINTTPRLKKIVKAQAESTPANYWSQWTSWGLCNKLSTTRRRFRKCKPNHQCKSKFQKQETSC
ncbi:A disintegrin and metalloproteinase with thrombospondin motifs 16 [Trichinella pseudospiralis]|uniref:A disintegrin and metalloproteinase with thrombospondin motifs 16 n=1 Tax=Trichinella pseudospiralis TaxID=6337 RepID=A0A0V1ECA8_TRIPS|nr:A disintegrin and metalloproteinase with thrombospondin motifs 16 [Trichinella pseudospiralis]